MPLFDNRLSVHVESGDRAKFNEPDVEGEFYRYTTWTSGYDYASLNLEKWKLLKPTPCGFWIRKSWDHNGDHKKWVSSTARKRFAYPTKKEALFAYKKRTERYCGILRTKLDDAKTGAKMAELLLRESDA